MCGIAGLVDPRGDASSMLNRLLAGIAHRGPDDEGAWVDTGTGVALGHRRLAIIDTSPAGHQPMASAGGRFQLTYNGEIYNYADVRAALQAEGHAPPWRGHSDTEVMLAGFEAWGVVETLQRCNGMFALAVFDRQARSLTLARDRMGEKPLYFGRVDGRFCFASELKALTAMPGWRARMAPDAIASFLGAGYVRGLQSAVAGVLRLPAGCTLTLRLDELDHAADPAFVQSRMQRFWSLREIAVAGLASNDEPDDDSLHALLEDAVRLRMVSDVPLGAFLSGGIDSSLVVALMQVAAARPVRTFSIGFHERAFDEAPHARAVAAHLGTNHTELYCSADDALSLVPGLAERFDEPFADTSQLPTMLVSRMAREHVTVALSGDGGDELFAGYGRYHAILTLWNGLSRLSPAMRRMASPVLSGIASAARPLAVTFPATQGWPHRLERLSERLSAANADGLRLAFIAGAGLGRMQAAAPSRDLAHCLPPQKVDDVLRRLMYGDQLDYLPDDILHKVDRASMAYALEARVPLLDHRVVEASWRIPTAELTANGQGKQPLRRLLARHVPRELFERPKQGFSPPIDSWLRGPLRAWAESLLDAPSLAALPWLDERGVRAVWQSHQAGRSDAGTALWSVLLLSDWRRRFAAE